jgi:hypothetical protein
MKIVIFIPTTTVENNQPTEWFVQRLDAAVEYYKSRIEDDLYFVISGRWNKSGEQINLSEAEVAKQYIFKKLPEAKIILEDISLELGGNMAFSKPIIAAQNPDLVALFCSQVNLARIQYLVGKIFAPLWKIEYFPVCDSLSKNPRAIAKEPKALIMFKALLDEIEIGDDEAARKVLMYNTPFYFDGLFNAKSFFDEYWPGGFEDIKEKRLSIQNK